MFTPERQPDPDMTRIRPEVERFVGNIEKVIKGKPGVVRLAVTGILARGHLLFEDVPGVGKTTLAQLIALSMDVSFNRIQFTSDLLPSDILGTVVFLQDRHEFEFKPGPIFAGVVLADEINRSSPKTQSALLEAMSAGQVTIDKTTHKLPEPFFVVATQNPVEFHGTFPLPKSQMDRFLMRLNLGYPSVDQEVEILRNHTEFGKLSGIGPVATGEEITTMQRAVDQVRMDDSLLRYCAELASATRTHRAVRLGVSPRGAIALRRAAQASAWIEGRDSCIPDDLKAMVQPVFAHRLQLHSNWEGDSGPQAANRVLEEIVSTVNVPL
jgi:MoxR-like ATPase